MWRRGAILAVLASPGCSLFFPFAGDATPPNGDRDAAADTSAADGPLVCGTEDGDGDGVSCADDCDDDDPGVFPGAPDGTGPGEWRAPERVAEVAAGAVDLALDDRGVAHLLYSTETSVVIATQVGPEGAWRTSTVVEGPGRWNRLQLGASGIRHVVTYVGEEFRYRVNVDGARWDERLAQAALDAPLDLYVGLTEAIVFQHRDEDATTLSYYEPSDGGFAYQSFVEVGDTDVSFHTAFATARGETVAAYAVDSGTLWMRRGLAADPVEVARTAGSLDAVSLEADSTGWLLLAYRAAGDLFAAWEPGDGEEWTPDPVASTAGVSADLAFDSEDRPSIVSVRCDGACREGDPGLLMVHTFAEDTWAEVELSSAGQAVSWTSIAIDGEDAVHIAYADVTRREVYYLTNRRVAQRDTNCDEVIGVDADGDGHASIQSGGGDCDDASAGVHPGAADPEGSDDRDCDGER